MRNSVQIIEGTVSVEAIVYTCRNAGHKLEQHISDLGKGVGKCQESRDLPGGLIDQSPRLDLGGRSISVAIIETRLAHILIQAVDRNQQLHQYKQAEDQ